VTPSKRKKPIEKGITYEDIFQHYYVEEVKDWCKAHNLKTSGRKKELIKRILDFLEGGKEGLVSTAAKNRGKKRKEREDEDEKEEKKNGKKAKTSKGSKKSKDDEKDKSD